MCFSYKDAAWTDTRLSLWQLTEFTPKDMGERRMLAKLFSDACAAVTAAGMDSVTDP